MTMQEKLIQFILGLTDEECDLIVSTLEGQSLQPCVHFTLQAVQVDNRSGL